jgi:CobQ-like glutamine amidotransferase family enzyme
VAIAKVHAVTTIYSDEGDIRTLGERAKIKVVSVADLPLPPQKDQIDWIENADIAAHGATGAQETKP